DPPALAPARARRRARLLSPAARPVAAAGGDQRGPLADHPVARVDRVRNPGEERPLVLHWGRRLRRRAPAHGAADRRRRRRAARRGGGLRPGLHRDDRSARRPSSGAPREGMKRGLLGLLIAALVVLPPLGKPYVLHVVIVILINVVYAQALYVIMRMGYLSFGHAGYIALGGYTSALLATKLAITPWIGFLAGGVVAGIFAWALGAVTLKLRGIYFSLSVFAFAEFVNAAFRAFEVFGGPDGIEGVPRYALLSSTHNMYLLIY